MKTHSNLYNKITSVENLILAWRKARKGKTKKTYVVEFVGFRNFYYFKLLRKRNIRSMKNKIKLFNDGEIDYEKFFEIFQGWNAYAK